MICRKCRSDKPHTTDFFPRSHDIYNGVKTKRLQKICKNCVNIEQNERRKTNPNSFKNRKECAWKRQGIKKSNGSKFSYQDFLNLLEKYENSCAICKTKEPGKHGWGVDHDHKTGFARGILCCRCNTVLGMANDETMVLMESIKYLDGFKI